MNAIAHDQYDSPARRGFPSLKGGRQRRKLRLTARHPAALKLQGRYMGTMRGLKARQRAKVKKIRAAKGIRAAIRAAGGMASA